MSNIIVKHLYETTSHEVEGITDEGDESRKFNDRTAAEFSGRMTQIHVSCGEIIDGIRFSYSYNTEGSAHGGTGGRNYDFTLDEGEYLTRLDWYTVYHPYYEGTVLCGIHFTTSKQRVLKAEGDFMGQRSYESYSFTAEEKHAIVGLKGYCGRYLNKITKVLCRETDENFRDDKYYYNDYYSLQNARTLTKVIGYSALVVDKLQFVYDNDPSLTEMHGNGNGSYFEFVLESGDYITKMVFHTAHSNLSGYGSSKILLRIEIWTQKGKYFTTGLYGNSFSQLSEKTQSYFYHPHDYTVTMKENEELFCLAGVYSKYMGRVLSVYKRTRSRRSAMGATQRNSDGKKYLFVCQRNERDGGVVKPDPAVASLIDMMLKNYTKLKAEVRKKIAFLPDVANSRELASSDVIISDWDFQKAVLSGQYQYISIRSHGTEAGCGNYGAGLADVKWVRANKKEIMAKLRDTVINFNCCECGCRNGIEQYAGYQGFAREWINAGLRAAFAYTISYLFVENASIISDPEEAIYYVRFSNLVDNKYLQLCDSQTPEEIAEAVKAEYKRQLFGTGAGNGYAALLPDISTLSGKDGVVFDNKTDIVRAFGKKLRTPGKEALYTEDGDPRTTEAALTLRIKLNEWLKKYILDKPGFYQRLYAGYLNFFVNYTHLCGPGKKKPDSGLKKNNLGEMCTDFAWQDGGEL